MEQTLAMFNGLSKWKYAVFVILICSSRERGERESFLTCILPDSLVDDRCQAWFFTID